MTARELGNGLKDITPPCEDSQRAQFPGLDTIRPDLKGPGRVLRICIATEDIVGPIRNGGIGTTYTHLALLLAEAGHNVTILYLRGGHSETDDIRNWVQWYRRQGIRFMPVDVSEQVMSPAPRWILPIYALYEEVKVSAFDLVHVSEWRGSAYLCLLAKRQGLAFQDTVFCVKASSPWLWNREEGLKTVQSTSDLVKMYAERRSIELADIVVGGSAYLLRWMRDHGYRLPTDRTFVQPNVVKPIELPKALRADRPSYGSRVAIQEIVFFGRLEYRKGLDLFCEAINNLLREGLKLPPITFMGKFGTRIPDYPELSAEQYIHMQTEGWPMEWQILDQLNQHEALRYLHGEGKLAVMPSRAENSTLTVYETTHFGIPFIATNVGGTAELITETDREAVLVEPHPLSISDKLRETIASGGLVAAPSFVNEVNLGVWLKFHSKVSIIIDNEGWPLGDVENTRVEQREREREKSPMSSVCLVLRDNPAELEPTINLLLRKAQGNFEIVLVDDNSNDGDTRRWLEKVQKVDESRILKVYRRQCFGESAARNYAARKARGDYLLFLDPGAQPKAEILEVLAGIAARRSVDILMPFYDRVTRNGSMDHNWKERTVTFLAGDPSFTFFCPQWRSPAIYIRKGTFEEFGGFTTDYNIPGAVEELVCEAIVRNKLVESVPETLVRYQIEDSEHERCDRSAMLARTARPYIRNSPLCIQPLLLTARSLEERRRSLRENNEIYKRQRDQARNERDRLRWKGWKAKVVRLVGKVERITPWPFTLAFELARRAVGKLAPR